MGLLHRSTHVLLFRMSTSGLDSLQVLLQRRSLQKKVGAGLWDVSVAEHLSSGEDYSTASLRGLAEELNLKFTKEDLVAVRSPYLSKQAYPKAGVRDYMFTTLFGARYNEEVHGKAVVDPEEVHETRWWSIDEVLREAKKGEEMFTRWFLIELDNINLRDLGKSIFKDH
ncbi:unnamed protein product [Agarophyton chilense]